MKKIFIMTELIISIVLGVLLAILVAFFQSKSDYKKEQKSEKKRADIITDRVSSLTKLTPSTTIVGIKNSYQFIVDNENRKVCYIDEVNKKVISFEDIINVELVENGTSLVQKSTMRTIGGTIIGGVLAGGAGAVVGGLSGSSKVVQKISKVQIRMRIRNLNDPVLIINCFDAETMTQEGKPISPESIDGHLYKTGRENAQSILDLVCVIIDDVDKNSCFSLSEIKTSIADELTKLAELKTKGILTQDEFEQQKDKLLSKS